MVLASQKDIASPESQAFCCLFLFSLLLPETLLVLSHTCERFYIVCSQSIGPVLFLSVSRACQQLYQTINSKRLYTDLVAVSPSLPSDTGTILGHDTHVITYKAALDPSTSGLLLSVVLIGVVVMAGALFEMAVLLSYELIRWIPADS